MAQTKKQEQEVKEAIQQSPPKDERSYLFSIQDCPGYEGYIPKNLKHEVCKYCGQIDYYH
jgi:hypothetical protein